MVRPVGVIDELYLNNEAFAASSSPHRKTSCSPGTFEGSTMTSQLTGFSAFTTLVSGNARWICSPRLSVSLTNSVGGKPAEKSSGFARSNNTFPARFALPAARRLVRQ